MNENIKDAHRYQLGHIVEAAKEDRLALFEVTDAEGKPAVLLVSFDRDSEGTGGRMAPLARIDVDFDNEFTPPDGVETVAPEEGELTPGAQAQRRSNVAHSKAKAERDSSVKGLDNAGEGC